MSKPQAVVLDRDGTIGGTGHFVHPRDFTPYPGALAAIALLKEAGIKGPVHAGGGSGGGGKDPGADGMGGGVTGGSSAVAGFCRAGLRG